MSLPNDADLMNLLTEHKPALLARNQGTRRVRVGRAAAWEQTSHLRKVIVVALASEAARHKFSAAHLAELTAQAEGLETRCAVFYAADLALEQVEKGPAFDELARRVREADALLFRWAFANLVDHPTAGPLLERIRLGRGYRDDAEDVIALVALLQQHWDSVKATVPFTAERLAELAREATTFLTVLNNREILGEAEHDLRGRAWTAFEDDCVALILAGRYLGGDTLEARRLYPRLAPA